MLRPGQVLDGYKLLRPIGAGGFGQVWLSQSEALGDFRALKFIPATGFGHLEREFDALCRYRAAAGQLRSPSILPIEHVNRTAAGLFYVMPLGDGRGSPDPTSPDWHPLTLAAQIEARRSAPTWFSLQEIRNWMTPLLQALQLLADSGLVHRDVKPDNILFLNGSPCLGDISLLGEDRSFLTRRGTPGYSAPSWFLESGGHPDMYGAAMTLYSLLTGNPPDKVGRVAFRWPPQGERSFSPAERKDWLAMHRLIARAVDDRVAERFLNFTQFERALADFKVRGKRLRPAWFPVFGREWNLPPWRKWAAVFLMVGAGFFALRSPGIREFAQHRLEDLIFPDSHPLSRHSRDCNLKLSDFRGEVANESLGLSSTANPFFTVRLANIARELNYLPNLPPEAVPTKVTAIRDEFLSAIKSHPIKPGAKLRELKKTAELLAQECGEEAEKETRESIQRLESSGHKNDQHYLEQLKAVIAQIEKLMKEDRWSTLAEVLEAAKQLAP